MADATDSEPTVVTREIDVDLPADELWELIADGERWSDWLVDEAAIEVSPGSGGTVVDGGEERTVGISSVRPDDGLRFAWWPTDRPDLASSVELTVVETPSRAVLRIVEVFPPVMSVAAADAAIAWEVRACSAWLCARATTRRLTPTPSALV